ncbi:MAG: hypothetical protein R3F62_12545 [Planctomycetota bacterium]
MFETLFLARRGRGIGALIAGLGNGEPWAWGILAVVIAIFAGPPIYRALSEQKPEAAPEPEDGRQEIGRDAPSDAEDMD